MSFSLVLNHAPWCAEREPTLKRMIERLIPDPDDGSIPWLVHDIDYRGGGPNAKGGPVFFTLNQWSWAVEQPVTHHLFMTDDLGLAPRIMAILDAMVTALPDKVIGLMSHHPHAPSLADDGYRWYRTNSWVVGPAYIVPHGHMLALYEWAEARGPTGSMGGLGWNDDSELNEWVTYAGPRESWHPIPTPIEHMTATSTWSTTEAAWSHRHETVSWRQVRSARGEEWVAERMTDPGFWRPTGTIPMLGVV